jgi:hypothetical protein
MWSDDRGADSTPVERTSEAERTGRERAGILLNQWLTWR